jgi:uncharacterized protein
VSPVNQKKTSRTRRILRRIAIVAVAIAVAIGAGLAILSHFYQRRIMYQPSPTIRATPRESGLPYEDVTFRTEDGLTLAGWYVPAQNAPGTIIFFHGNGGNIGHYASQVRIMHDIGWNVLLFDYRGYGASEGLPTEEGTYLDAAAAREYILSRHDQPPGEPVLLGRSMGGAVASWLAEKHRPRGLILESSFTSVPDMAAALFHTRLAGALSQYQYDTLERMGSIHCPVLVIHSPDDRLIPYEQGQRLFEAAGEPKQFLEIQGGHNDGFAKSGDVYKNGLAEFLGRL